MHCIVHLHVGHYVHPHVGRNVSHRGGLRNGVSTLCEVSETLTEWKSKTLIDGLTDKLNGLGARDTCVSEKGKQSNVTIYEVLIPTFLFGNECKIFDE